MRGHFDFPTALLGACLTEGAVDPTAVPDILLPTTPPYGRQTGAPSYMILGNCRVDIEQLKAMLGLSKVMQGWD